jgi:hypothetical protein
MNKTSNLTIALLAFAGAAYSQNPNQGFQRGSLINGTYQASPASERQLWLKRQANAMREQNATCVRQELGRVADSVPARCDYLLIQAANYERELNAAEIQRPQRVYDTTNSSQAMQSWMRSYPGAPAYNIPVMRLPPPQAGQQVPSMRTNANARGGFPRANNGRR